MVGKRRCPNCSTVAETGPFGSPAKYPSRLPQGVHVSETLASSANPDLPLEPDPRRWSILAVVIIAQLMVVLDASIVTIALPSAQRSLHISVANRQWVITAYTLAFGGLLLLGGRIADFGGRKRMFFVGSARVRGRFRTRWSRGEPGHALRARVRSKVPSPR